MEVFLGISLFIFGSIIGSFLNVVLLRHGTGRSLGGRSGCATCRTQLSTWQLIPIGSFLILRGRCYACKSGISAQYPIVEFITGVLFVTVLFMNLTIIESFIVLLAFVMSVLVFIYDLKHMIIPNIFVLIFTVLSVVWLLSTSAVLTVWSLVAGPIIAMPIFLLWFFSGGKAMGFGDVKLMFGVGWFTGILGGLAVLYISFVLGAVVGLYVLFMHPFIQSIYRRLLGRVAIEYKKVSFRDGIQQQIPFGPFIIIAFLSVFIFNINIMNLLFL